MPSVARFRCPGCAADMQFDPAVESLKCPYCGTVTAVPKTGLDSIVEHPFDEHSDPSTFQKISQTALEISCSGCGAVVQFEPPMTAGSCTFCAAQLVAQPKDADPLLAPDGLLPFAVPKENATRSVRDWLASRWFAPNELKKVARPEGIHGIYLPFWTFDARTDSQYTGERGTYYYERVREGNQEREVRRTRWSPVSGEIEVAFDDVLIPASRAIDGRRLTELEPWDLDRLSPYEPAYLSGFQAQRYQVDLEPGLEASKQEMAASIQRGIEQQIGGDEQRVHQVETAYSDVTFKHLLLPVWLGAYRFQGRVFQVAVNARTAEVQGERPYSAVKIAFFVLGLIVLLLIFARLQS